MTEEQIIQFRLLRIGAVLKEAVDTLKPFLSGLDGVNSTGNKSVTAFDVLERFVYNSLGVLPLLKEFGVNHNMAVPLSQIFRAIAHDVIIAYWLFGEENAFDDRLQGINGDFIKTNSRKLSVFTSPEKMQEIWRVWQKVSPDNFAENVDGTLQLNTLRRKTFESICEHVNQHHNEHSLKSLPHVYAILSQQAHVSTFSKIITYNSYDGTIHVFDAICRSVLPTCILLLNEIEGTENTQAELTALLNKRYSGGPDGIDPLDA